MIVDRKKNNLGNEPRFTLIDTNGAMIAQILKLSEKNAQDIKEMKTMLKRLSN